MHRKKHVAVVGATGAVGIEMIKTLERNGFIQRTPGQARSIRLLVAPEHLPALL